MEVVATINVRGRATYTIQTLRNLCPSWAGYPIRRRRLFICGWREDIGRDGVTQPLACLVGNPMTVDSSYLAFLGMSRRIDWSRVGECPTAAELLRIADGGCKCGVDPYQRCDMHQCKCNRCGHDGRQCSWRGLFAKMVEDAGLTRIIKANISTLTYLQVMESQGQQGPDQQRERVLINILASKVDAKPLNDTLMIADLSQNPPHGAVLLEGDLPTLTTTSRLWCFQTGEMVSVYHLAIIMGVDTTTITFEKGMSATWFRQRLGLTVHVANFGMALMAALTPPLSRIVQ